MNFRDRVLKKRTILLDGGFGSALLARGLPRGVAPESWTIERRDAVVEVHRAYVEAGSEAIHTSTFGANPIRLRGYGLSDRCDEINRAGVELARQAGARFVIGDVGPTGEYLPPVGKGDPVAWRESFAGQGKSLAEAGVDAFHVETMSDLREARIALEALLESGSGIPILVSMTFEKKKSGFFTVMGNPLVESLAELAAAGALAVGANCSVASSEMKEMMIEASRCGAPLVAQPNAGAPVVGEDGVPRYRQAPDDFASDMESVAESGVVLVGGCCGTDERFIAALAARMKRNRERAHE